MYCTLEKFSEQKNIAREPKETHQNHKTRNHFPFLPKRMEKINSLLTQPRFLWFMLSSLIF